jgi:NADH-quinone oxidoreductase subunit C
MLTNEIIQQKLTEKFGDALTDWHTPYDMLTFTAPKELNLKIMQFLYDDETLKFRFLTDLQAVHFPDNKGKELSVVYHLHSFTKNIRLRIKCYMPIEAPQFNSITSVYEASNWQERETYDFFGIEFVGHPNLKRILNVDEMDYFPMRKEYPLEDQTRTDKDDKYFGR